MNMCRVAFILVAGIVTASCSEKSAGDHEKDSSKSETRREAGPETVEGKDEHQPDQDQIAEDCVAFVRATRIVPAKAPTADCPGCPAQGTEVLAFRQMKMERISCSGDTCTVLASIRVSFNVGAGEEITGGLTAWILPEQRNACLSGHPPAGEETYRVQITYRRRGEEWRAIEYDRGPAE